MRSMPPRRSRRAILPLVMLWLTTATLASAPRRAAAAEPVDGRPVRAVEFEGLQRLSPHYLRSKIQTRAGEPFSAERLSQDVARLYALGEFSSEAGIDVMTTEDERGVVITFRVKERPRIARIVIKGRDALSLSDLADDLRSKRGNLLDLWLVEVDKEKLRNQYIAEGYLGIDVDHLVRPARQGRPGEVDLVYLIQEGRRVLVGDIEFIGNTAFESDDLEDISQT